ncbi:recombinase family protein [Streptomyces iakyrus]|uniref:hypothetical protein n=1 Tax=Streptomyces iakyrus TaxID=68219 RepID=UPI0036B18B2E
MKTTARVRRVSVCIRISDDREGAGLGVKRQLEDCRLLSTSLGWNVETRCTTTTICRRPTA